MYQVHKRVSPELLYRLGCRKAWLPALELCCTNADHGNLQKDLGFKEGWFWHIFNDVDPFDASFTEENMRTTCGQSPPVTAIFRSRTPGFDPNDRFRTLGTQQPMVFSKGKKYGVGEQLGSLGRVRRRVGPKDQCRISMRIAGLVGVRRTQGRSVGQYRANNNDAILCMIGLGIKVQIFPASPHLFAPRVSSKDLHELLS